MLIRDLLHLACVRLENAGVDTPEIDAGLLLSHCLGKSRTALYLIPDVEPDAECEAQFLNFLQRREQREPLAYILGCQEFWSLDFLVSPDVLIPRPETELLLEKVIATCRDCSSSSGAFLDLCCGSGVIAIVLAKELGRKVLAVDISMGALMIARENASRHGVAHLIDFVQSDLLTAFSIAPCFSLVVSNPPYVSKQDIKRGLQPEVDRYEPHLALDGGDKGLDIIRRIRDEVLPRMLPGADLFMEIGAEQYPDILSLYKKITTYEGMFAEVGVDKDYSGHDRIFHIKLNHQNSN